MNSVEKVLSRNVVYRGKILDLRVDNVRLSSGKRVVREVVEHEPAVAVIPLTSDKEVLLVKQFRYALEQKILEIPAGIVEEGETFKDTAIRELQEEIGYYPGELMEIGRFFTSPGFSDEVLVIFLALDLCPSSLEQDDDEEIVVETVSVDDIPRLLKDGSIRDCKTFGALSWLLNYLKDS
ncbi:MULTISPECIES: NUDIX hydrolase [Aminobacterium]|jgi:ADP-ribose pyrophosphatase|uniref:NUDIX hydrolase n=1 Tax=Aminobacterium colombiense (strain DSM 12261 / ALA-1) TaxID=572547 RepID=D5EF07_AMICL|nr:MULTISPECIES: NUDIX hydrolase [Aminobacterium]MDD2378340.1 NUDIX hydrolase [Aminobacterium colombiense]ADE57139.1 NUDIX hydrolase [Aminobacterium colombiense DSM 12261]MDD3767241.1 NUDIX hydrolase [Aminobacterium colombiense]MDD4265716.1 NUDIX hydrolase [Aminobacterium colombiense]MDD4585074.1 NUDIX hydrolase [Aminobacterium colombiense]